MEWSMYCNGMLISYHLLWTAGLISFLKELSDYTIWVSKTLLLVPGICFQIYNVILLFTVSFIMHHACTCVKMHFRAFSMFSKWMVQFNLYIYMQHWFKHILFNKTYTNRARHYAKISAVCSIESSLCKITYEIWHIFC